MLQYVPAISLWCLGLYTAAEPGMLLHGIQLRLVEWSQRKKTERLNGLNVSLQVARDLLQTERAMELEWEVIQLEMQVPGRVWLVKPVLTCVACMCSLHGTLVLVFYAFFGNQPVRIIDGLVSIISSVFVTRLLWSLYGLVKKNMPDERLG